MRGIITVVGKDMVGILAKVSGICSEYNVNVIEVSQSILQDMFCMIMLVEFSQNEKKMDALTQELSELGSKMGLSIHMQREELFDSMHRI